MLKLVALAVLLSACDVDTSFLANADGSTDATADSRVTVTAAALTAAKPGPPDPGPKPGPIVVGGPNSPAVCGAEYWWCVGGCQRSPFALLCQGECYRTYLFCTGAVGP